MARSDEDLFDGIVRILKARPGEAMRVIVVDADTTEAPRMIEAVSPTETDDDVRVFRVKWNVQGHGVIAQIAVEEILKKENNAVYKKLKLMIEDDPVGRDSIVLMAQWPDRIKPPARGAEFKKWQSLGQQHRKDHYVNYALDPDKSSVDQPIGDGKLLTALAEWSHVLANETDDTLRGHALAFLTHLIGDIHQPLHCSAVTGTLFPIDEFDDGDQGGNLTWWGATGTMHSLWDDLILKDADKFDEAYAALRDNLVRERFADRLDVTSYEGWSRESYKLAREVYAEFFASSKHLHRTTRTKNGKESEGQLFEPPTTAFRKWAKGVAFEQGRLAAFRLADKLAELLG